MPSIQGCPGSHHPNPTAGCHPSWKHRKHVRPLLASLNFDTYRPHSVLGIPGALETDVWVIYPSVFLQLPFSPTSVPHPASSSLARILPAPAAMTKCQSRHLLNNSGFPLTVVEAVKSKINVLTGSVSVGPFSVSHRLLALSSHARGPSCVLGLYMRQKKKKKSTHEASPSSCYNPFPKVPSPHTILQGKI